MKKADVIRELKADLKDLENAKIIENLDYHRGKMDMLKSLIRDFQRPTRGRIFPSQTGSGKQIKRDYPEGHFNT
ncbi:MAG: hypothetical protein KOO69_03515 [Victivallales bacterium]|nr:hypothetical protein [Victivallales bacterium]